MSEIKTHTIVKQTYSEAVWDSIVPVKIENYQWMDNGYEPNSYVKLFHDGKNIYLRFTSFEKEIIGRYKTMNDPVCDDSCVEFFFCPAGKKEYINFETNVLGTLALGIGSKKENRHLVEVNPAMFGIKPSVKNPADYNGEFWTMEYKIPFSFIEEQFGSFDLKDGFYANFYKCGEDARFPHYGLWSPVKSEEPDFHILENFGLLHFE